MRPTFEPTKVVAVHLTYRSRIEEYGAVAPDEPSYFLIPPSAIVGDGDAVRRPRGTRFLNYEGELAVVIGRRMHAVATTTRFPTWPATRRRTTSGCTTSA